MDEDKQQFSKLETYMATLLKAGVDPDYVRVLAFDFALLDSEELGLAPVNQRLWAASQLLGAAEKLGVSSEQLALQQMETK